MQLKLAYIVLVGLQGISIQPVSFLKVREESPYEPSGQSGQCLCPVSVQ